MHRLVVSRVDIVVPAQPLVPGVAKVEVEMVSVDMVLRTWIDTGRIHVNIIGKMRQSEPIRGVYLDAERANTSWTFISSKEEATTGSRTYPVSRVLAPFDVWAWWKRSCVPIEAVIGGLPHWARDPAIRSSSKDRFIPPIIRYESSYAPNKGNTWEYCTSVNKSAFSGEIIAGASTASHHMFISRTQLDAVRDLFWTPNLSASIVKRMLARSVVIPNGISVDRILAQGPPKPEERSGRVGSFYRPTPAKGVPDVLVMYSDMARAGQLRKIVVTDPGSADLSGWLTAPQEMVEHHQRSGPDDFYRLAHTCAVAVWNSVGEGSPVAPAEAAAAGCVPIFPRRPWFMGWEGSDWPLVYSSLLEVPGIIAAVSSNLEEWTARARAWALAKFDGVKRGNESVDFFENVANQYSRFSLMSNEEFGNFCDGAYMIDVGRLFSKGDVVTWENFRKIPLPGTRHGLIVIPADISSIIKRAFPNWTEDISVPYPVWRRM